MSVTGRGTDFWERNPVYRAPVVDSTWSTATTPCRALPAALRVLARGHTCCNGTRLATSVCLHKGVPSSLRTSRQRQSQRRYILAVTLGRRSRWGAQRRHPSQRVRTANRIPFELHSESASVCETVQAVGMPNSVIWCHVVRSRLFLDGCESWRLAGTLRAVTKWPQPEAEPKKEMRWEVEGSSWQRRRQSQRGRIEEATVGRGRGGMLSASLRPRQVSTSPCSGPPHSG
eukprot:1888626-Rhodomonas_salina.1